jgi:F-type H+-transporting ATPase subunit epsilon
MTSFALELVTPERILYRGDASAVSMRTDEGEITFLAEHSPFVGALDVCVVTIEPEDGEPLLAAFHGGFVRVDEGEVTLCSPVAELGSEIDIDRARAARGRAGEDPSSAEATLLASAAFLDPSSAAAALRRADARLAAAGAT